MNVPLPMVDVKCTALTHKVHSPVLAKVMKFLTLVDCSALVSKNYIIAIADKYMPLKL